MKNFSQIIKKIPQNKSILNPNCFSIKNRLKVANKTNNFGKLYLNSLNKRFYKTPEIRSTTILCIRKDDKVVMNFYFLKRKMIKLRSSQ